MEKREYNWLDRVDSPRDLKRLSLDELRLYCDELRHYIIEQCAVNPGHLASSLGAVELAAAVHYVFDTPDDRLVWDVGHQAYAHKILTGRREQFHTNRKLGGISGFPRMEESPYDAFGAGHASVSISAALGMAQANKLQGIHRNVIAVIGDGAMTGGLAYEGLNNAGASNADMLVILNDNSMDKRLEALEKSDRFWATSGTWDIRQGFSGSDYTQNANGNVDVPADTVLYRDAVTDLLFQKLTWTFKVGTVGAFAFGTRDGSGAANGYYVLVNPADKTLKIYNSDWKGTLSIKRNLTIDFDILAGETYYAEIIKTGTLSTEFTLKCISAPGKTFSYTHNQLNNKLRGWGGVAFGSAGGVFELVNMTQKARSEAECEVLLIGDSFLENASSELESEYAYAYKLREKLGEKLIASGRGGATTTALKNKYTTDFLAAKAKYTVLQIGSNDSLSLTVATFKMNLLELIGRVEENGSIPVLVTIPRRYDTDNTAFITEANAWIKSLGYWYIDEYALLPADRLLNDTIHPNAEGHDLILSNLLALIPV